MKLGLLALLSALIVVAASATGAGAHLNPCHLDHACPSDNHTYAWQSPDGQSLVCTSHSYERLASDTITVTWQGYTYWCHAASSAGQSSGSTGSSSSGSGSSGSPSLGKTVMLQPRSKSSGCVRGVLPDRTCSPGAYYSGLTKQVLCSSSFRTGTVRNVPESEKFAVEREYGMTAKPYGRTIEIDHIVSLELGGSNDISNLFPEPGSGADNYHNKDVLENAAHKAVCAGQMSLADAQQQIASNWIALYKKLLGRNP